MGEHDSSESSKGAEPSSAETTQPNTPSSDSAQSAETSTSSDSRAELVRHAQQFLAQDEVRDASTEKKIEFLEKKGLRKAEITELLGVERNDEASNRASMESNDPVTPEKSSISIRSQPEQATAKSDLPPIITYPEFLTTPTQPAPLVTARRLMMTLYFFGTLSLAFYGTSKYFINPMLESLTTARLSLSETAQANLDKLVARLQGLVSVDPGPIMGGTGSGHDIDDVESSDGDPTELFHRDIGVQTDPPSSPVGNSAAPGTTDAETVPLEHQMKRLSVLRARAGSLVEAARGDEQDHQDVSATLSAFKHYLDGLAYVVPSYSFGNGGLYTPSAALKKDEETDEISQVKAQIRGVKGMLLSARSFPAGIRGVR